MKTMAQNERNRLLMASTALPADDYEALRAESESLEWGPLARAARADAERRGLSILNTTTADEVAAALGDDGQNFTTADGKTLGDVAREMGAVQPDATWHVLDGTTRRYEFRDGSAIVISGNAWDLRHPDCTCGFCWRGGHNDPPQCEQ